MQAGDMEYKYSNEKISNRETITYFLVKYELGTERLRSYNWKISPLKSNISKNVGRRSKNVQ